MANDISYTAIGTFNANQIIVDIALDNVDNKPFRIVEKYDLSRSLGSKFYNAVLLHVDNNTINEVVSSNYSFPAVIDIASLLDFGNAERFDSNLEETLIFVAHESENLELNLDDLVCKIHEYHAKVKAVGSFSESYKFNKGIYGPPKKIGVSIIYR